MNRSFLGLALASPVLLPIFSLGVAASAVAAESKGNIVLPMEELVPSYSGQPIVINETSPGPQLAQVLPSTSQLPGATPAVKDLEAPLPVVTPVPIGQVTSVTQLSDLKPTDWAYQAVQSLVERYGCIVGYPDSTFRGNRAATRFELAAALNACLDVISDRFATKEDLQAVRRLQEEFAKELATLKGRVNNLEARTAKLESQQFSTTTKLRGVAVVSFSNSILGDGSSSNANVRDNGDNPIVSYRVRLNLDTSFSGKDLLRTRLQAGNTPNLGATDGLGLYNTSRLNYDIAGVPSYRVGANSTGGSNANLFTIDKLLYRFPVFGKGFIQVDAFRNDLDATFTTFNPYLESPDRGSLSRFFRFNPVYRVGGDAGVTFGYPIIQQDKRDLLRVTVAYHGGQTAIPGQPCTPDARESACYSAGQPVRNFLDFADGGLFGGPYSAAIQIESSPLQNLRLGAFYSRTYGLDVSGGSGTTLAARPFSGNSSTFDSVRDQTANNFGFQAFFQPLKRLALSGWVGYSQVFAGDSAGYTPGQTEAQVLNWAFTLASPDLWRKGDLAAIAIGQSPHVIGGNGAGSFTEPLRSRDREAPFLVEAQYRFQINPNISVTPGIIAVFNPNGANDIGQPGRPRNDTAVIGVIRTTFTF